jgi:hypothetical protein
MHQYLIVVVVAVVAAGSLAGHHIDHTQGEPDHTGHRELVVPRILAEAAHTDRKEIEAVAAAAVAEAVAVDEAAAVPALTAAVLGL